MAIQRFQKEKIKLNSFSLYHLRTLPYLAKPGCGAVMPENVATPAISRVKISYIIVN